MARKEIPQMPCSPAEVSQGCCKIEAVVSVDERGQMVLPKEIRDRAGIRPGDKLGLICWEKDGAVCCLSLIKIEELTGMVKTMLGPVVNDIFQK